MREAFRAMPKQTTRKNRRSNNSSPPSKRKELYDINGRLLRPAMVGVSKGGPKPGTAEKAPEAAEEPAPANPANDATIDLEPADPTNVGGRFNETV